ncbi:MAG: fibronectin type III domain-containing protein, partial [Planctomycetes bacterium]|nr:fibronectin type III domain-containing protein [Planctomycetota bacterium]
MAKFKLAAGIVAVAAIVAGAGGDILVAQSTDRTDTKAPLAFKIKGPCVYVSSPAASRIDVFWHDNPNGYGPDDDAGVVGYHVYRDGRRIATVEKSSGLNAYPDTNLSPATKYAYTVTAFDKAGNESRHTEPVSATTRDKPAPNLDVLIKPSRTSGVAPLSVFFDVTDTGSFTDGTFVDATCAWNFDVEGADPKGKYRQARGFVAAHVFENPGTYKVRCDVYDVQGRHDAKEVTIKVEAFSGRTYYVAANGADNNPGTMEKPVLTVAHALNNLAQPNTRILFRKGDTFEITRVDLSNKGGPVIIGSYSDPT